MTQLEIAAAFVVAFSLFMFGYALGWRQRGQRPTIRFNGVILEVDGPLDAKTLDRIRAGWGQFNFPLRGDPEASVRRLQQ